MRIGGENEGGVRVGGWSEPTQSTVSAVSVWQRKK